MSVILPGSGHFYLRRRGLAACEFLCALVLLIAAIGQIIATFLAVLDDRARISDIIRVMIPWMLILAACSVIDGLFTLFVSRRRVILE